MRRDMSVTVTRDRGVTSRVPMSCDERDVSRVSHATTTTPHHTPSLVQVVCGLSGSTSIDLTVGLDSPPEAWMETDDLDLLDDTRVHCECSLCGPAVRPPLSEFVAVCGRRAICRSGELDDLDGTECPDCLATETCPRCGAWF